MASFTWTSDADQDAVILRAYTESNNAACDSIGIARGSTQAQVDAFIAAANAENPPRLVGAKVNIYGTAQQWVRDVIRDEVKRVKRLQKAADRATYEAALAAANQTQKDAVAAALGLPAGTLA